MTSPETNPTETGQHSTPFAHPRGASPANATSDGSGTGQIVKPRWPWIAAAVVIGVPAAITGIGMATSPPAGPVPSGHILYLDADQPSEKTTMLHGLYSVGPSGAQHLIVHEQEPQDVDAGVREWIIEPAASPDGKLVAFVKENIVLVEEKQSVDNQIWIVPVDSPKPTAGRMLYDLSANKQDMVTRLAWTPDGKSVAFAEGRALYTIDIASGKIDSKPIVTKGEPVSRNGVSDSSLAGFVSPGKPVTILNRSGEVDFGTDTTNGADTIAVSRNGSVALGVNTPKPMITVIAPSGAEHAYTPKYGWSIFGGRRITSLHFAPDNHYLGYTISKPPVAENEIFYLDTQTGKCYKLPFRCGPAAWDWSK